ncbi:3-methyl-2-oxobutanoate hydroxymethyltransferase [Candidatus Woesearchaeota archaeon]|nr:3-methyl-2-oxobutanoate hydroxymethyltransferase [Candidatus Woesearchaeota archaeon]
MGVKDIVTMKRREKITVLTCYDYPTAKILEEIGIDLILVGDSLGNVVLGYDSTKKVTMQDIIRHTGAVRRGAKKSFIIADMPYGSDRTADMALRNARLLIGAGADAVKVEGKPEICKALSGKGIDVMGHIGYLPQTATKPSVHRDEEKLLHEGLALEDAGCFSAVLEMVQQDAARRVTEGLKIPTIGIGAGPYCDGQVLVLNDMLGMYDDFKPRFAKRYAHINDEIREAVREYNGDVKEKRFPGKEHSFG